MHPHDTPHPCIGARSKGDNENTALTKIGAYPHPFVSPKKLFYPTSSESRPPVHARVALARVSLKYEISNMRFTFSSFLGNPIRGMTTAPKMRAEVAPRSPGGTSEPSAAFRRMPRYGVPPVQHRGLINRRYYWQIAGCFPRHAGYSTLLRCGLKHTKGKPG